MAVSNYTPNPCKYRIDELDNVVYVVNKDEIGGIKVADGEAYIDGVGYYNAVDCLNVSLSESESLDERYEFLHTVNFSVKGYLHWSEFNDYYIMLRDKNNTYWLVNPYFKIQYTYTYTLDGEGNHTDYVVSTKSNYPLLRVKNFNADNVKPCNTYDYCAVDVLAINESTYSKYVETYDAELEQYVGSVKYTNDGFKVVKYMKNTCTFTETFDGKKISHEVKFNIHFDDYKSSWHYNLLEFTDNKYAVVLSTKCGMNVATGFGYGLQPSYSVTADDNQSINHIEITLSDLHDTGNLLKLPYELPFEHDSATTWNNVEGEYTCIDSTTAVYTLRQKYDVFGNPKDEYMCLEGFESRYEHLNIVGTFTDEVQFYSTKCSAEGCSINTSLPSNIVFYSTECKTFSIRSNSNFTISSNSGYITVSPTSGAANTLYTVEVCNTKTPTSTADTYNLTVTYCNGLTKDYAVTVVNAPVIDCLPNGSVYNVSVYAQDVTIPTNCCIQSVSASCCVSNIQIQNGYVSFRIEQNNTNSERTITLTFTKCDGTTLTADVIQAHYYSKWVYEGNQCHDNQWCAMDRMYSGTTSDNINTPTYITRYRDCEASSSCIEPLYKWENMNAATDYYCNDCPVLYKWENIDPSTDYYCNDCQLQPQYRWINLDPTYNYYCSGTTKFYKQQQQISTDNGVTWTFVSPAQYRMGGSAQTQSSDCGYVPTIQYEWRRITPVSGDDSTFVCDTCCVSQYRWVDLDVSTDYYCSGTTKYYKQQKQVSTNCGETWNWVSPAEYQWGASAQTQSTDCGYVPSTLVLTAEFDVTYTYGPTRIASATTSFSSIEIDGVEQQSVTTGYTFSTKGEHTVKYHLTGATIGSGAFYDCYSITDIDIPSGVTSIGESAFFNCNDLASINIPNSVISIGNYAFNDCRSLPSIVIPDSVTSIGENVFNQCSSLTSCTLSNSITSLSKDIFSECGSLTSIDIPSGVTSIGDSAFDYCYSLSNVNIPDSVTSIGSWAFSYCRSLTSIDMPNSVTSIGRGAFQVCSGLTSVTIPNSVTSIGSFAFNGCSGLTSVTCLATTPPALNGSSAFYYTPIESGTGYIYVPAQSIEAYKSASSWKDFASRIQPIT